MEDRVLSVETWQNRFPNRAKYDRENHGACCDKDIQEFLAEMFMAD